VELVVEGELASVVLEVLSAELVDVEQAHGKPAVKILIEGARLENQVANRVCPRPRGAAPDRA